MQYWVIKISYGPYFLLHNLIYDHPSKLEVANALASKLDSLDKLSKGQMMGLYYAASDSSSETAMYEITEKFGVTRERVRQVLWKIVRSK